MKKNKLLVSVLIGLMVGQLFAEGDSPIKVSNTVRFGYDDNVYRNTGKKGTTFITDTVDMSFRAALSDRTDLIAKTQLTLLDDTGGTAFNPNLYAVLSHAVSPRLLMRLSESYRTGNNAGSTGAAALGESKRYQYYNNRFGASADYVLARKDRLEGSFAYDILRNEDDIKRKLNGDTTTVEAGAAWKRDIIMQRTYSTVKLNQRWVDYDHQKSSFDATDLSAGLNHTFNQQWQGSIEGGFTQVRPDYPAPAKNESSIDPLVRAGLSYSPSPRTRITGDVGRSYVASGDKSYGGQTTTDLQLGFQHDITAKLTVKATASFGKTDYAAKDSTTGATDNSEERMVLGCRLTYKLNRMHYLETGVKHSETTSKNYSDWKQNVVDVGWRVDFN